MADPVAFRHAGGGRKGLFVVLRYVFIVSASYLVIFQYSGPAVGSGPALMIAIALASNVGLSILPQERVFGWYVEAPVMIADTIWVSWALHQTGSTGVELFLLYFFVLFLAWVGERVWLALAGSTVVSLLDLYLSEHATVWNSRDLLRVVFFYSVALFYGYVLGQIQHERRRADRGFAWARALELKVVERTDELRVLYNASLEAGRLKSEFVASISHEMRTPLNVILGYTEMLLDREVLADLEEHDRLVTRARAAACGLLQLVDSVLDLGKLDAGKVPVDLASIALDDWMAEQRERDRIPLHDGVRLEWQVSALPVVRTDPAKLRIVLDNLVNNAIKFTTRGAITVGAQYFPERDAIEFRVEDTGPGIPKADVTKIFDAFHQAPNGRDRGYGGVGLGLAIVDRYVRLLGGRIAVESMLGVGTRFVFALPRGSAA
jgi:signal transduction histidine kinase